MRWILGGVAVLACAICGLLGLTAGINFNPSSTIKFVPAWGSLGDWVSGIGALLAVITSLVLVIRNEAQQREREREKIEIEQIGEDFFCSVRVISLGIFPCTVRSVFFLGPDGGVVSLLASMAQPVNIALPVRLEHREEIHFAWRIDQMRGLLTSWSFFDLSSLTQLRIQVLTVTGDFIVPISVELASYLVGAARAENIAITVES